MSIEIREMTEEDFAELEAAAKEAGQMIDYNTIPPLLVEGLQNYQNQGIPVGDFLQAVLRHDLFDGVGRADPYSMKALPSIVSYVYMEMDSRCHGSKEVYDAWLAFHKAIREHGEDSEPARNAQELCFKAKRRASDWQMGKLPWPKEED